MALTLDDIEPLFAAKGDRMYAGEPVTQLQHALQSAQLAEQSGADASADRRCALARPGPHGQRSGRDADVARYRRSSRIRGAPVLAHVVRRCRAAADPVACRRQAIPVRARACCNQGLINGAQYWANLSADSKRSLELQGGIFTDSEAQRFISQPHADDAVSVRLWDDAAKIENAETRPLSHYLALAKTIALRR